MSNHYDFPLNLYSKYIKNKFGERVQKISINTGLSCPNRDGTKGFGGCTFCNNDSFSANNQHSSIREQIERAKLFYKTRYNTKRFIVYFQSYSNTYAPLESLRNFYEIALADEDVIGLAIATRPDCVELDVLHYLSQLSKYYEIIIEYGLESFHDETLDKVNRKHSVQDFFETYALTKEFDLNVCVHLMLGFPWETEIHFNKTCQILKQQKFDFIKIHQLQIVKNTVMAYEYLKEPYSLWSIENYMDHLERLLPYLSPHTIIQRLFSQYSKDFLISPATEMKIGELQSRLLNRIREKKIYQGMLHTV